MVPLELARLDGRQFEQHSRAFLRWVGRRRLVMVEVQARAVRKGPFNVVTASSAKWGAGVCAFQCPEVTPGAPKVASGAGCVSQIRAL